MADEHHLIELEEANARLRSRVACLEAQLMDMRQAAAARVAEMQKVVDRRWRSRRFRQAAKAGKEE